MNSRIQISKREIILGTLADYVEITEDSFSSPWVAYTYLPPVGGRVLAGLVRSGCIERRDGIANPCYRITEKGYAVAPKELRFDLTHAGTRIFSKGEFVGWME